MPIAGFYSIRYPWEIWTNLCFVDGQSFNENVVRCFPSLPQTPYLFWMACKVCHWLVQVRLLCFQKRQFSYFTRWHMFVVISRNNRPKHYPPFWSIPRHGSFKPCDQDSKRCCRKVWLNFAPWPLVLVTGGELIWTWLFVCDFAAGEWRALVSTKAFWLGFWKASVWERLDRVREDDCNVEEEEESVGVEGNDG